MDEADAHLLELIRSGSEDGWRQFVSRFQRRLTAFADRRVASHATAEDLVQETFVGFLKSAQQFRQSSGLETFLFQILRRRIVDHYRRQGRTIEVPMCQIPSASDSDALDPPAAIPMGASWYVREQENRETALHHLRHAIRNLANQLQAHEKFRELKIAEGLFYAGRKNRELAQWLSLSENDVAVIKRRLIQQMKRHLETTTENQAELQLEVDLLVNAWEEERPSCPKRTTLGKYILGILPEAWDAFVRFHVDTLGCAICEANLVELKTEETESRDATNDRLFQSTIGFFKRPD